MYDSFNRSTNNMNAIKELIKFKAHDPLSDSTDYSTIPSKIDHIWKND